MSKSISKFIKEQFPKYILETDSMFPFFMEAYYEWMSKSDNPTGLVYDLDGVANVDNKYQIFIDEFINEYVDIIPDNVSADKTLLIKKITELYQSKGTNKSIELLFRILYDIEATIVDPSAYIFKPSSAKYIKPKAVRFNITSGSITETTDVAINFVNQTNTYAVRFDYVLDLGNNLWEGVFQTNQPLVIDGTYSISSQSFTANIVKTVSKKTIKKRGSGFKVGDIFEIATAQGLGTKIKITRVQDSGIKSFDIIQFGTGYLTNFEHSLSPLNEISIQEVRNLTITNNGDSTQYTSPDNIDKLVDSYQISKFTYLESTNYLENNTYVGELQVAGQTEISNGAVEVSDNNATIFFELGYLFSYPGYYLSNEGVASDISRLQDGEYWQQFSYVIKSSKQYDEYNETVKKIVHPAGVRMFGEYTIDKKIELLIDIQTYLDVIRSLLIDSTIVTEEQKKDLIKNILYYDDYVSMDGAGTQLSTNTDNYVSAPSFEKFNVLELITTELQKTVATESINFTNESVKATFTKLVAEVTNTVETLVFSINKLITETAITFEQYQNVLTKNIKVPAQYILDNNIGVDSLYSPLSGDLDIGNGEVFGTLASVDGVDNINVGIDTQLIVSAQGSTLTTPDTYNVLVDTLGLDSLVSEEESIESFGTSSYGGVVLNPYYSPTDLINNNIPYWQFGYTTNERIIQ